MKEHPILFSAEMVKAILEGRKTETRRIIKPQPDDSGLHNHTKFPMSLQSKLEGWWGTVDETGEDKQFRCPYGEVGDHLWVRETWAKVLGEEDLMFVYKATNSEELNTGDEDDDGNIFRWKPSIFMPRKASRILLLITDIRVERLRLIEKEDDDKSYYAEGLRWINNGCCEDCYQWTVSGKEKDWFDYPEDCYEHLWDSINGRGSYKTNPWVWVVTFKRI